MTERLRAVRLTLGYVALALLAFPITEMLVAGADARQYAHDVFDDGSVGRLGALAADWRTYGPTFWDPYLTAGNAWWSQFAFPPLSLDTLLTFAVAPFQAYFVTYLALVVVAGVSMHLFLRDTLGLATPAAASGGILATFSFWHYVIGFAVPLLPLGLWLLQRASGLRAAVLFGLLTGFVLYTSQLQVALIVAAVQAVFLVVVPGEARGARLRTWLAGWLIGASLYAPALVSQLVHLPISHRTLWRLSELIEVGRLAGPGESLERYGSIVLGLPILGGLGASAGTYGTWFTGLAGVLGAIAAVLLARSRPVLLFAGLLVAVPVIDVLAVALVPLYEDLPVIGSFQFVRVRHMVPFLVIVLAACGLDALLRCTEARAPRAGGRSLAVLAIGAVLVAAETALAGLRAARLLRDPSSPPLQAEGWALGVGGLMAGAAAVGILVAWFVRRRGVPPAVRAIRPVVLAASLALLVADRALYARAERDLGGGLGSFSGMLGETPAQAAISASGAPDRTISIDDHPNRMLFARIRAADGYQNIYPRRYHDLFGVLIEPNMAGDRSLRTYYEAWGNRAYAFGPELRQPILDLLDVRWAVENGALRENPTAFGRAFVPGQVRLHETADALLESLRTTTSDALWLGVDLIRSEAGDAASIGGAGGTARVTVDTPDRVVVEATAAGPSVLVLTDAFAPGWQATVDGRAAPILPAYLALRGVVVPAGTSTVEFLYRPWFTWAGLAWAALTLVGCAALVPRTMRPRR